MAELSFQLLGYASFLIPALLSVAGVELLLVPRQLTRVYTKLDGACLFFGCTSAFFALTLGRVDLGPRPFRAGGYIGEWIWRRHRRDLNRTGSVIVAPGAHLRAR